MPTYVYAITDAGHPSRLDGVAGVGDPAGQLRALDRNGLKAVVSDAPDGLRAKRRDLMAHQLVLERLLDDGAILPMRFGLVSPDDHEVLDRLGENNDVWTRLLREVDGRLEYNLKVSRDEDALLREIIASVPEARRLNDLTLSDPGAHHEKVALGELLAHEIQVRQERDAHEILERLAPRAERDVSAGPAGSAFLNVSFLVAREKAAVFSDAVHRQAEARDESYSFALNGPLPPYSFV